MDHTENEFDLQPLAQGLRPKTTEAFKHLALNANEKLILARFAASQEYNVFLKLAMGEIEKAETEHFQSWKNKELFERSGLIAVAQRLFLERLGSEIRHQVDEFAGEVEFARTTKEISQMSPEEFIERNVTQ
jgi:hypothetical protein